MANYHDAKTIPEKIAHLREWGCGGCKLAADDWEKTVAERDEALEILGQIAVGWHQDNCGPDAVDEIWRRMVKALGYDPYDRWYTNSEPSI